MKPSENQQLAMPTVQVFLEIEDQILTNIAKHLKKHRSLLNSQDIEGWRLLHLSEIGSLTQQNIITIAKRSGLAIDEVSRLLEDVGYKSIAYVDQTLEEAVKNGAVVIPPGEPSGVFQNILLTYQNQANETFNLINSTMLQQSQQSYIDILNQTVGKVLTGTKTPQQALREALLKWTEKGIPALVDRAGKEWSTEAYISLVTRSMTNKVSNEMQFSRMDEYGVDLIEVSSHLGARPRCAPFQGRIYSRSGTSKKYSPLSETSYGEIAGLRGVNCGHVFYAYVEGISIKRNEPFAVEENNEAYKRSQKQRYLERQIRHAKRELNMMSILGDEEGIEIAKQRVRERHDRMRAFIQETGRTRRRDREQLGINNPNVGGGEFRSKKDK
ncbi:phage minor capsid protein [Sutcliffiella sp. NC1]|uniref:phage minor capsid protein n=1 Tax=Sutcliffiella sp. NC1 TaxID=3004096 RepID=UPI0022DDC9A6|nr:phage minor capsid protein [Sutcliffiella sp. NC1]WBL16441.1 phage minor capsid protein [Sutcliffiella sp. NC1]